ncbi:MAG: ATP-binding protein [Planctomycetaceae bacterium]
MSSHQPRFRSMVLTAAVVYVPLAVAATAAAVWALGVPGSTALLGLIVFTLLAGFATFVAASRFLRRLNLGLGAALEALTRIEQGDFETRFPGEHRYLLEPLAESLEHVQAHLRGRFAELQANRDQLRTVLNSMVEGVIAVDSGQRVLLVNDSACRLFRIQEPAALGRPLWELVRNPQFQQWVSQAVVDGEPAGGELELLAPISKVLSVRIDRLSSDVAPGAIVVASDISQLRRLEQVRQEFVANASHELKTPLASIKACVETLLDGAIDDVETRVRFLETVNEQSDRLDRLVRDLLSLTRIESGGMKTDLHSVPLAEIVAICHERYRQHAGRKQMKLVVEPPETPISVLGDEEALEQVLDNLVDNAIKYTNEGGVVTIRWRLQDDGCVLEVEDTGIGIPQSHQARIFERFYRVDKARSRELGGTGLGLAIVKHLVQALGGAVNVSSRLGKGSVFSVQLRLSGAVEAEVHSKV